MELSADMILSHLQKRRETRRRTRHLKSSKSFGPREVIQEAKEPSKSPKSASKWNQLKGKVVDPYSRTSAKAREEPSLNIDRYNTAQDHDPYEAAHLRILE